MSENTEISESQKKPLGSSDLQEVASSLVEKYSSTAQGVFELRQSLLDHCPDEAFRSSFMADPVLTRLTLLLYNQALQRTGIEDEMLLHYHFTSPEGVQGISQNQAIKAIGEPAYTQIKKVYHQQGALAALKKFFWTDNLEAVGIHATSRTKPEQARSAGENTGQVFIQRLRGIFGISNSFGLQKANLRHYYEIISAKSDRLFQKTIQSHVPLMDIDEVRCRQGTLRLDERQKYLILGPYQNTFLKQKETRGQTTS